MKSQFVKPLTIGLCAALLAGGVGFTGYALKAGTPEEETTTAGTPASAPEDPAAAVKDETVYILAGADGSVQKIIVSDWIKNTMNQAALSDKTTLTGIETVKGSDSYTLDGDSMRVWDAKGGDIYYQGSIEKELPVSLSVSYALDGRPVSAEELAGKSGRVTIRFTYKNNQYETVDIDGKPENIYVPFTMLTGLLLDGDRFTNVEVSNGKILNDGSRLAVIGLAFPGLQSNLQLDADTLDIPDYVEIRADVKGFEMTNTMTLATQALFNQLPTGKLDSVEDLRASLDELSGAMDQLLDGSSQLYGGLDALLDKSGELAQGVNRLAEGAAKLKSGAGELDGGAASLSGGAAELNEGLKQLAANSPALRQGAAQVFDSLLHMADTQLAAAGLSLPKLSVGNYAEVLGQAIASLDESLIREQAQAKAKETVTAAVNAQRDTVTAAVTQAVQAQAASTVTAAVRAQVEEQVLASLSMTKDAYEAGVASGAIPAELQAQIAAAIDQQMAGEAVQALIAAKTGEAMQASDTQALIASKTDSQIAQLIEQQLQTQEVQSQITAALEKARAGAASLRALKEQLDSYHTFYTGLNQYTAGVDTAQAGAQALRAGADQLKDGTAGLSAGTEELYNGVLTLKDGVPALREGVSALRGGAMQLSGGLQEFQKQGVQKLIDAVDGDLAGLATRIQATADVSRRYRSFSGLSDEMDGQVKFIYRTDAVKPSSPESSQSGK